MIHYQRFEPRQDHIRVIDRHSVASQHNAFKIYTFFPLNIVLAEDSNNPLKAGSCMIVCF